MTILIELEKVDLNGPVGLEELLAFVSGWHLYQEEVALGKQLAVDVCGLLLVVKRVDLEIREGLQDSVDLLEVPGVDLPLQLGL